MAKPPSPTVPLRPPGGVHRPPHLPGRPTFGLMALACPSCGDRGQRLCAPAVLAGSAQLSAQIHVAIDFCCTRCTQAGRSALERDEGEGEIILGVSAVETVAAEDVATPWARAPNRAPEPSSPSGH